MTFANKYKGYFAILASILFFSYVAYFLKRTEYIELLFCWISLFGCFFFLIKKSEFSFNFLAGISFLFRFIFLMSIPNLSQDFYRFIWDGRMIFEGINPYQYTPQYFINQGIFPVNDAPILFDGMGILNAGHFTNYPPIHQFVFFIAALFSNKSILGSILIFRLLIVFADLGTLYFGKKLLLKLNLPIKNIFWYILNPFIIIEMTGNLHFEPIMLCFLLIGLYQLSQKRWVLSAVFMACAVSVKLIPLLFLPLFFQWFVVKQTNKKNHFFQQFKKGGFWKLISFYGIILFVNLLLFLPFLSKEFLVNYTKSVSLWFDKFEFNASFYYLFREIGYFFRGYNEIAIIGKITALLTMLFLGSISFFRNNKSFKNLIIGMLFSISFYYFFSTTVHPWYIATPLILGILTNYKFPMVWSFLIIFSYQAYANEPWKENLWLIATEYIMLYSYLIYELKKITQKKQFNNQ